ncbi:hypothetical protein HDV57DRAFT_199485 [Trichoderma longibrachiatum]
MSLLSAWLPGDMDRVWSAVSSTTAACIAPASDLLQIYTQSLDENNRISRIRYIQTAPASRARDPSSNPSAPSALAPEKIPRGPGLIPGWDFPPLSLPPAASPTKTGLVHGYCWSLCRPSLVSFKVDTFELDCRFRASELATVLYHAHSFSQEYTSG